MKFALCVLVVAAVGAMWSRPADNTQHDDLLAELTALEKQSWEAWQQRNGAFFEGFLAADHVEVGPQGIAGKDAVVRSVSSHACVVASYSTKNFTVTVLNQNTAVLNYWAQQDTKCGGKPVPSPAWVSSVYVLRNQRWQNALYQQTFVP